MNKITLTIRAFVLLGEKINRLLKEPDGASSFSMILRQVEFENPWFTNQSVCFALQQIANWLTEENIINWLKNYPKINNNTRPKRIAVIMAGNIPLVGFHDFFCVLISGNIVIAKISSKDSRLLKWIATELITIEPTLADRIIFKDELLDNFDAVIATGSNNSLRYFEYYFSSYPHIFRHNRNSVAVLTGNETPKQLELLADDIFIYFGLGCRNVSKIFLPQHFNPTDLFIYVDKYKHYINHNKYANNYEYYKAIFLMNQITHFDNGFMLLKPDTSIGSPVAVLYYEVYNDINNVVATLKSSNNNIQCVVTESLLFTNRTSFGNTQKPAINEFADNIDVLNFLIDIK